MEMGLLSIEPHVPGKIEDQVTKQDIIKKREPEPEQEQE
jgi:hypothetical protein